MVILSWPGMVDVSVVVKRLSGTIVPLSEVWISGLKTDEGTTNVVSTSSPSVNVSVVV